MSLIGYTVTLSVNSVVEVEIIGDYEIYGYVYKQPTNKATYRTKKYNILNAYDVYGNKIDMKDNIFFDYKLTFMFFVFDLETALQGLRQKLFFDITGGFDTDITDPVSGDKLYCVPSDKNAIFVKKDDIDINFSGTQYIYDNIGYIRYEFYHNNGIKEGVYKISNPVLDYDTEIIFCNDVEIDSVKKLKN
jgi:hypothetical protein